MSSDKDSLLPADWRDREDGYELLTTALIDAYSNDNLDYVLQLADVAGELAYAGARTAATTIVVIAAARLLERPLEFLREIDLRDDAVMSRLLEQLSNSASPTEPAARVLSLGAYVDRRVGNTARSRRWYEHAARMAREADLPQVEARTTQSLGAMLYDAQLIDDARGATTKAHQLFASIGDTAGWVATGLNLVEYDVVEGKLDVARRRLDELEPSTRRLRNPHLYASHLARTAALDVNEGDIRKGRRKFHQALRSAVTRSDRELEVVVLGHLAGLARDESRPEAAAGYARRAYEAAEASGDREDVSKTAHELAIDLVGLDNFEGAIDLLNRAIQVSAGPQQHRVRADLGAVLVSRALAATAARSADADTTADSADWLRQAEDTLLTTLPVLVKAEDADWTGRVLRNLRVLWLAQDRPAHGADFFDGLASSPPVAQDRFSGECLRLAGVLAMSAGYEAEWVLKRLRRAALLNSVSASNRVSLLIEYASAAEHSYSQLPVAVRLYDDAIDLLSTADEPSLLGNVLNDSAIAAAGLEEVDDALERLDRANRAARERGDRVLGSLTDLNAGELLLKENRAHEARTHFERAARQAESFGDLERAASAYSSWANSLVNDETVDDLSRATQLAAKALTLASSSGSNDAVARARSADASILFAQGDYDGAYRQWIQARQAANVGRQPVYAGFALEALARKGDWRVFSRQIERFTKSSQRHRTQLILSEALGPAANVWLRREDVRHSAKVLAYSLLLAAEGYGSTIRLPIAESRPATTNDARLAAARAMTFTGMLLTLEVIPSWLRAELRTELVRALEKQGASREAARQMVNFVDEFAHEDDE